MTRRPELGVVCARMRLPVLWVGAAVALAVGYGPAWPGREAATWAAIGLVLIGLALYLRIGSVHRAPITVSPPVVGRWTPVNSPASRVPSHGMHAYGQTYAIDLVYEPSERSRPGFGCWPLSRPPTEFPGFGQPVLAPVEGTVVRTHGRERDHRSRTSVPALVYLFVVEAIVREILGPGRILGNHVLIDTGDGAVAVLAHLRRGSIMVSKGQCVRPGDPIAACGNSGNSTEPHLHFQLMDNATLLFAAGLPFVFDDVGPGVPAVPGTGQSFVADPKASSSMPGTIHASPRLSGPHT